MLPVGERQQKQADIYTWVCPVQYDLIQRTAITTCAV